MKRLQVMTRDENFARICETVEKCNEGFNHGTVKVHDVVDWMLSTAPIDIQKIRMRCLNPKKIVSNAKLESRADLEELMKQLALVKPLMKDKEEA